MKTFESYLKENLSQNIGEHTLCARETANGIQLYIHPSGKNGETLDFTANGNLLVAAQPDDSLLDPGCRSGREEKKKVNQCQEAIESLLEGRSISECKNILDAISTNLQEVMFCQKFSLDRIEMRYLAIGGFVKSSFARKAPSNPENKQYLACEESAT